MSQGPILVIKNIYFISLVASNEIRTPRSGHVLVKIAIHIHNIPLTLTLFPAFLRHSAHAPGFKGNETNATNKSEAKELSLHCHQQHIDLLLDEDVETEDYIQL